MRIDIVDTHDLGTKRMLTLPEEFTLDTIIVGAARKLLSNSDYTVCGQEKLLTLIDAEDHALLYHCTVNTQHHAALTYLKRGAEGGAWGG